MAARGMTRQEMVGQVEMLVLKNLHILPSTSMQQVISRARGLIDAMGMIVVACLPHAILLEKSGMLVLIEVREDDNAN